MNILGNGNVRDGANIGKSYACALWGFASPADKRRLRCLLPVEDRQPIYILRGKKKAVRLCDNDERVGDAEWLALSCVANGKLRDQLLELLLDENFFFYKDGQSWVSSVLLHRELLQRCEIRICDTSGMQVTTGDINDVCFVHLSSPDDGFTMGCVWNGLFKNTKVVFDGVPYVRAYEGVAGLPSKFVFATPAKYWDATIGNANDAFRIEESDNHFKSSHRGCAALPSLYTVANPLSVIFSMGRCFVDSLGSSFLTAGGNAMQDALSSNFVDAMNITNDGDGIFLYAPKTYASDARLQNKGSGDALSGLALDNLVDGTVVVVTAKSGGDFNFLSECGISVTSRHALAGDRNTQYDVVDRVKRQVIGHHGVYDYETGAVEWFTDDVAFSRPSNFGDDNYIVFTPGARAGRVKKQSKCGLKSGAIRSSASLHNGAAVRV